nr:MAG TPA: DNA packaging protein [Caudoviricetes sp.]
MTNVTIVDELVSSKIVAKVLGISSRRVQQLTEDGIFEKEKRGQYNIAKTVQAFVAYKTGESKLEKKAREGGYDAERTLLTRTKRMIEENKLKIMNGELHRSNTVKAVMNRMLNNFKSKLQSLPLKAAPKVLGETNLLVIQDVLLDEVNECLTELSEYDPNMFHDESDDIIVDDDEAGEGD